MTNGSEGGQAWVRQWLLQRLADDGYIATPADREVIDEVLALMAHDHHENRTALRMSTFLALLPNSLEQRFQEWREGGAYGIFDSEIDAFAASDWITFQMHEIMPTPRLAYAFIDYAFRKIYEGLDGTPTFIYVEEATFMLNNPKFLPVIDEWLKTFRKLFAFVWLTMQSPQSITQGAFSAILLDNIFTFLFGPNVKFKAHRAAYCEHFGLLPHHVDLIGTLPSVGTFLMVQNGQKSGSQARILRLKLDPYMLAYLRSEIGVLNCLDRHLASAHPNWKDRFLAEVALLN
jgi:type IV secretion system protein VirB4